MFMYSGSVKLISFKINSNNNWFQKMLVGRNLYISIRPRLINVLVPPYDAMAISQKL